MTSKVTAELVKRRLCASINFLRPHYALVNDHLVNCLSESQWQKHVPNEIKDEIRSVDDVKQAIEIYWDQMSGEKKSDENKFPNFRKFLSECRAHTIEPMNELWISPDALKRQFGADGDECVNVRGFMTEKKNHEVEIMADVVDCISNATKDKCKSFIVDAGGGKGYLSSRLALEYNLKVLGVDWNPQLTSTALTHSQKLNRNWNAIKNQAIERVGNPNLKKGRRRKKSITASNDESKQRSDFSPIENYRTTTHFITSDTDFIILLDEHFDIDEGRPPRICLTGLHTCGNLSPSCIRTFHKNRNISSICNIGCCYHLLNEKFFEFNYDKIAPIKDERSRSPPRCEVVEPIDEINKFGFPMSRFLNEHEYKIGRNARMVACQSIHRVVDRREMPHTNLFYRSLLEVLVVKCLPEYKNKFEVGRIKSNGSFADYVRKVERKQPLLRLNMTDDELNAFCESHYSDEQFTVLYYLIRLTFAQVVETIILLDRFLYLKEIEECEDQSIQSHLVRFFDEVISPRCYGIVAVKC